MSELAKSTERLPSPSAEIVLWRVSVECFLTVVGRRKANLFLRLMTEKLASEESLSAVIPLRAGVEDVAVRRARAQAMSIWQRFLPIFLARVPPE